MVKTVALVVDVVRLWLDVRLLRRRRDRPQLRTFHCQTPNLPGYRRRRR